MAWLKTAKARLIAASLLSLVGIGIQILAGLFVLAFNDDPRHTLFGIMLGLFLLSIPIISLVGIIIGWRKWVRHHYTGAWKYASIGAWPGLILLLFVLNGIVQDRIAYSLLKTMTSQGSPYSVQANPAPADFEHEDGQVPKPNQRD